MLANYREEKQKYLNQYDKLLEMKDLFPVVNLIDENNTIELSDIVAKKESLVKEHFFVSITGQIKSGKSTLINALIFGKEIIPADDTPHTAKLTLLKYSEKPKINVEFYTEEEWGNLKREDYFKEYLEPEVEQSISQGVFDREYIKPVAYIVEDSIDNLKEYVAKGGKYTPYVNLVTVYYPNEILKEVTIVDTPGINDPNKIRDRVAKEWIDKTNANIYTIYAGQAFSKVDMDFLDNYLLSVPKGQKITVLNQIDTLGGESELRAYVDKLLQDPSFKQREIVNDEKDLVFVSALGALIEKMDQQNLPLPPKIDFQADRLDDLGYLNKEKHNLPILEERIENKLIENKGRAILESHQKFILELFNRKKAYIKQNISEAESHAKDLTKSQEELEKDIITIKTMKEIVNKKFESIKKYGDENIKKQMNNIENELRSIFQKTRDEIIKEIEKIKEEGRNGNFTDILWGTKDKLYENQKEINKILEHLKDDLVNPIESSLEELNIELIQADKEDSLQIEYPKYLEVAYANELLSQLEDIVEEKLSEKEVERIVKKNESWIWNTSKHYEKMAIELKNIIQRLFEKLFISIKTKIEDKAKDVMYENLLNPSEKRVKKILDKREQSIKNISKNKEKLKNRIDEISLEVDKLKAELLSVEKMEASL